MNGSSSCASSLFAATTLAAWLMCAPAAAQVASEATSSPGGQPPAAGAAGTGADPAASHESTQLQEVVVTAEKRSELLSKAPLAISTVTQGNMDELGITQAQDLVTTVPNFQLSVNGYTPQLSIRGIGNFSGSYSTVAVQVDGIYEPNTASLTNGLYDVGRIEVARGPQGTVYGRNATAGVLNIYTADPVKSLQAFGDFAYGNYSDATSRAVVNVPLGDRVQVRASLCRRSGRWATSCRPRNVHTDESPRSAWHFSVPSSSEPAGRPTAACSRRRSPAGAAPIWSAR